MRIVSAITVLLSLPLLIACDSERDREMFVGAQWWWDLSLGLRYPHGWHPQGVEVQNGRLVLTLHSPAAMTAQTDKVTEDLKRYCPTSASYLWELVGPGCRYPIGAETRRELRHPHHLSQPGAIGGGGIKAPGFRAKGRTPLCRLNRNIRSGFCADIADGRFPRNRKPGPGRFPW